MRRPRFLHAFLQRANPNPNRNRERGLQKGWEGAIQLLLASGRHDARSQPS
jgi:hypothetical protein